MQRMKFKFAKATETRAIRSWTETLHVRPMLVAMWKHAGNWPSNFPTKPRRDPGRPCQSAIIQFCDLQFKNGSPWPDAAKKNVYGNNPFWYVVVNSEAMLFPHVF